MHPAVQDGDFVLLRALRSRPLRVGDIVQIELEGLVAIREFATKCVATSLSGSAIKRVAAIEGQGFAMSTTKYDQVPRGMVFVLGDNTEVSQDSRHFGTIALDRVRFIAVGAISHDGFHSL